jgi:serine/threonine protein kinase
MSSDPAVAFPLVRECARHTEGSGVRLGPTLPAAGVLIADRYSLLRPIGEGGMAAVWLAHDQALDCLCALKVLRADQAQDPAVRARFEREAAVIARIRSTNVVRIIDRGQWRGLPYIAMEYLEGEDLRARLQRQGKLEPWQAYEVIAQMARGLTLVHARGVVHRDVKPENVFLVPDVSGDVAKLLDFGVAKQLLPSPKEVSTLAGLFLGTVDYASPEQLRGATIDWRSDLWSLGVLAFECLTGSRPFAADSVADLCGAVLHEPLPRFAELAPELPPELEAWLQRALARDPQCRFQSARELADALAVALACERTTIPSLPPRATLESDPGEDAASAPPLPRELPTRLIWLVGMAVATVCGFAGGFWLGMKNDWTDVAARGSVSASDQRGPELSGDDGAGFPRGSVARR